MPVFSKGSLAQLSSCDARLQRIADVAIKHYDFSVIEGHRGKAKQEAAVKAGNSQVHWPHGAHNAFPSLAFDVMPYPVDWSAGPVNVQRSLLLAGILLATGWSMGIMLRYGGDWNSDGDTRDEKFRDYGHFEIAKP